MRRLTLHEVTFIGSYTYTVRAALDMRFQPHRSEIARIWPPSTTIVAP